MNLIIIGLGGIGSHLILPLFQYLNYDDNKFDSIILVDGDKYENKNYNRQFVPDLENKAIATAKFYKNQFTNLNINFVDKYINKDNINKIVNDNDIVLLCVDNNKTRKLVEDYTIELENITIISGGNELYDGNMLVLQKKNNKYLTPLFTEVHPEIGDNSDKSPEEMSCEDLAKSAPQIGLVNATIADCMRRTLFALFKKGIKFYETFINCENGNVRNVKFNDIEKILKI